MPYHDIASLPEDVKQLPEEGQKIWMKASEAAYEEYGKDESKAFVAAWAAIKKAGYKKEGEGWIKAADTTAVKINSLGDLPDTVKVLPYHCQEAWMSSYNAGLEEYADGEKAASIAWEAVKMMGYVKVGDHWMHRASEVASTSNMQLYCAQEEGSKWKVRIIQTGMDLRRRYWSPEVLKTGLPVFEGMKVFMLSEAQHQAEGHKYGKPPGELVGWIKNVSYQEDKVYGAGVYGNFIILASDYAKILKDNLLSSFKEGNPTLLGLSLDVKGQAESCKNEDGDEYLNVTSILKGSVDVVYDPAAGGNFISLAASNLTNIKKEEKMLPLEDIEKAKKDLKQLTCSIILDKLLYSAALPDYISDKLRKRFDSKIYEETELKAAIADEKECLDKIKGETIKNAGYIQITQDEIDARKTMFDDFFDNKVMSFKSCYVNYTGDENITGLKKNFRRLTSAMDSTSLSLVLQDSMNKKLAKEYNTSPYNRDWRKIASIVPRFDFRTNHITRVGGYGDLPIVLEGAPYSAATSPTDEEATYKMLKRGVTESITWEMIRNDDVRIIRKIPSKVSSACARQIYEFVFNFLSTNPVIYDGTALFTVGKGNLGTVALDSSNLHIRRRKMLDKTELSSGKKLNIAAKYLIVPTALDKVAYDLIAAPRNSDFDPTSPDYTRTLQLELIVDNLLTDANDWFLAASPNEVEGLEVGFLDGKEVPEFFTQDQENVGTVFTHDKISFKWRHVYNGAILDYRAFDGSIVA